MNAQCGFKKWAVTVNVAMLITVLRHWERGDRTSHGPALALLHIVAKEPKAVLRALG